MTLTISDSITIKNFDKNALLAGVGNELHLYNGNQHTHSSPLICKLRGKIHGIVVGSGNNKGLVLLYGEKEFKLLQWMKETEFTLLHCGKLTDWISAAKFLRDTNEFVLLTAHSIALHVEYLNEAKVCTILQRSSCSDKSTLYCAAAYGEKWSELVFFGGNAFGEMLIWQPSETKARLLHRIPSHNGVIFSIDYNAEARLLTTTSDDRSIRFWHVGCLAKDNWMNAKLIPLASGFGHVARVFQGRIFKFAEKFYAITVGEDSYLCVWRTNGELIHKCRQQFGATIWNFEYNEDTKTVFTVGSTGNVLAYNLQDILNSDQQETATMSTMPTIRCSNTEKIEHYVSKIKFLSFGMLVGITNQNHLVYNENGGAWQSIKDFASYKCTVLEVHKNLIAVCGYRRLTLYKFSECAELKFEKCYDAENILNGVVRAFKFLFDDKFLICDDGGKCLLLDGSESGGFREYSIELPKCKEPWLTSAALIDMQHLLISNRQGNIYLYQWLDNQHKFKLADTLKHPHGNLGATLIKTMQQDANTTLLKSAGHDGSVKLLKLCNKSSKLTVIRREIVPVAWVEALEPCKVNNSDCELMIGFNDNHFTVWSKLHDFSLQLPCGGGHRCWDFCIFKDVLNAECIRLVFIKNKQVIVHTKRLFNSSSISSKLLNLPSRNMWHVKPCNVLSCIEDGTNAAVITVSVGDDNLLKISKFENSKLDQITEIHSHISNIRALKVIKLAAVGNYLIFSGGGRAQLCVTKFNSISKLVEEKLSITLKSHNTSTCTGNVAAFSFDPETRIMALDVLPSLSVDDSCREYDLFIGCSDGFLRKYHVNAEDAIILESEINYGKCILQVHLVNRKILLIAATDGTVKFYDLQMTAVLLSLPHHVSGINALDIRFNDAKCELQLLTGGDDQDIVYSRLSLSCTIPILLETQHFSGNHTAQVTAAQLSACGQYAYTSGVDQNVLKIDLQTQQVISTIRVCVADIKGIRLCSSDEVCFIYGCGLQVYKI